MENRTVFQFSELNGPLFLWIIRSQSTRVNPALANVIILNQWATIGLRYNMPVGSRTLFGVEGISASQFWTKKRFKAQFLTFFAQNHAAKLPFTRNCVRLPTGMFSWQSKQRWLVACRTASLLKMFDCQRAFVCGHSSAVSTPEGHGVRFPLSWFSFLIFFVHFQF